jgi:hypothetical protein
MKPWPKTMAERRHDLRGMAEEKKEREYSRLSKNVCSCDVAERMPM